MAVSEFIAAGRRERRVLVRVSRAAWRLRSAEREREWALGSARSEGVSIRKLASAGRPATGPPKLPPQPDIETEAAETPLRAGRLDGYFFLPRSRSSRPCVVDRLLREGLVARVRVHRLLLLFFFFS